MIGADLVGGVGKPAPDVYLRACADLGADPRSAVALEDSAHGVAAAKAAGHGRGRRARAASPASTTSPPPTSSSTRVADVTVDRSCEALVDRAAEPGPPVA